MLQYVLCDREEIMDIKEELRKLLKGKNSPFLFIGSGFSMRYAGTPTWEALLKEIANLSGLEYGYYAPNGEELPQVASALSERVREEWWNGTALEKYINNAGGKDIGRGEQSALKYIACQIIENRVKNSGFCNRDTLDPILQEELTQFSTINVPGIITTNYDSLLDTIFPGYSVYVGQNEMLMSPIQGVGEIYKIHGSVSNYESLVLTKEDYKKFDDRGAYLTSKILTMFVENPIIFIGYSISDPNIKKILSSIIICLEGHPDSAKIYDLQNQLIFIRWSKSGNESREIYRISVGKHDLQIPCINVSNYIDLYSYLSETKQKVSAPVMRLFKNQLYELATEHDPSSKIASIDIEELEKRIEKNQDIDLEFIVGIGVREKYLANTGLHEVKSSQFIHEYLWGSKIQWGAKQRIEYVSDKKRLRAWMPIHKYLAEITEEDLNDLLTRSASKDIKKNIQERITRVKTKISSASTRKFFQEKISTSELTFENIINYNMQDNSKISYESRLNAIFKLEKNNINSDEFEKYLRDIWDDLPNKPATLKAKAVCFLDYLKYSDSSDAKLHLID